MLALTLPDGFNPVAVGFIVSAGIAALLMSRVLSVLVGLPARQWQRWCGIRSSGAPTVAPPPLRSDLAGPTASFAAATRVFLDELLYARRRAKEWNDGKRPGLLARCLGYRDDDDYLPTIEMFGEISRWMQHASAVAHRDGPEAPQVQHACARVRELVLADGELASRMDGIIAVVRELDARFAITNSTPYRDPRPSRPPAARSPTADDGEDEATYRARVLRTHEEVFRSVAARYADDESGRDDLSQDIRLAVWLALPQYRGDASLSTYIRRIAHYCGARFGRRQFKAECIDEPVDQGPDPVELLDDAERRAALRAALGALPQRQREAVELLLSGLSYREVAHHLRISESNASVRITRARKQLRKRLVPIFA